MKLEKKLIGIRIMQKRKEKRLSQEELAELIGFSKNHLSGIERGKYLPTTKFLCEICNALGETPDYYLLGQITSKSDELTNTLMRLPVNSRKIVIKLIETYLEEINNN